MAEEAEGGARRGRHDLPSCPTAQGPSTAHLRRRRGPMIPATRHPTPRPRAPPSPRSPRSHEPASRPLRERVLVLRRRHGHPGAGPRAGPDDFGGKRWEGCIDYLSLTRPDVVESIHAAYFEAGADIVETNSFQASRTRLEEWGLGERTRRAEPRRRRDRAPRRPTASRPTAARASSPARWGRPAPAVVARTPSSAGSSLTDLVRRVPRPGARAHRGRRRRADPRDLPGHPRDEGADPRRARGHGAHRAHAAHPVLDHARPDRPHAARHRRPRRARDARGHARGHHRAQLLDRART